MFQPGEEHVTGPNAGDVAGLNQLSKVNAAREVVRLALEAAQRPLVTTKFGPQSAVLLHLAGEQMPDIPVVWVDTGFNTRATLAYAERLRGELDLNLHVYRPAEAWSGWVPAPDEDGHEAFTGQVKLEPFARALDELRPDVWISSLRWEQTAHRAGQDHFNISTSNLLKVCPLIHWSNRDVEAYMRHNDLVYDADYHDPTKAGPNLECGLHLTY